MAAGGRRLSDPGGATTAGRGKPRARRADVLRSHFASLRKSRGGGALAPPPPSQERHSMTTSPSPRRPLPPFDRDAAIQKVRLAEDTWNTRDPARVATLLTRRQILASGVAMAVAIPFLPITRATAAPEPRTAKLRLTAGIRTLDVNGKPARVFGLIGPNGKPGIALSPGERFHVDLVNRAGYYSGTGSCSPTHVGRDSSRTCWRARRAASPTGSRSR